jgi:hypothetical protein
MLVGCFVPAALCLVVKKVNKMLCVGDRRMLLSQFFITRSLNWLLCLSIWLLFQVHQSIFCSINGLAALFASRLIVLLLALSVSMSDSLAHTVGYSSTLLSYGSIFIQTTGSLHN